MVILHIAYIDSAVLGGVQTAVPKMVEAQSRYADVGFVNLHPSDIPNLKTMKLSEGGIASLEEPFNAPDLVVFHELYRIPFIRLYGELERCQIPYIIVPHGCLSKQAQKQKVLKKIAGNCLLFGRFLRHAKSIQYLSDNEKAKSVFNLPCIVAGNGIDIPTERSEGSQTEETHFIYVGRLDVEIKGLDLLIKAISEMSDFLRQNKVYFSLFGPDSEQSHERLNEMIQNFHVSDLVALGGAVLGEEKKQLLLRADYFIQTSRSEGMPMGLLEALSYGIPCVATQGTGLAETIEKWNAGFSCQTTVDGIQTAIKSAVDFRAKRDEKSICAAKLAAEQYDRYKIAESTISHLKLLINHR